MATDSRFWLPFRIARRELRGGLRGFRVFLACLALGVAAIAGVGSLSQALLAGLQDNGRALLGGEVELRLIHREADDQEIAWLTEESSRLSYTAELRTMASNPDQPDIRRLVELKAVDAAYPLFGEAAATDDAGQSMNVQQGLERRVEGGGDSWGAIVDDSLLTRLELELGDRIAIGNLTYEIRGTLEREPDRAARAFTLGPRVMIPAASLDETGLIIPGSLIYHHYRLDLPEGDDIGGFRERVGEQFPAAGWRIRDIANPAPGMARFIGQTTMFMTLVGLTALLVGGVGIANAIRSYLDEKTTTIATLKCLGSPAATIFQVYLIQVLALAGAGIAIGLVFGAGIPLLAGPVLAERLNFDLVADPQAMPLVLAAAFGFLTALAFSLWPLGRAQQTPAARLFRASLQANRRLPPVWVILALIASAMALCALAVLGANDPRFAAGFVVGAVGALVAFWLLARAVIWVARHLPRIRRPSLRLAVANLHRPGSATAEVTVSLGLGLTVLVGIALIEANLQSQVLEDLPEEAPGFYFIDIQPEQTEAFDRLVGEFPQVDRVERVPMLRGRIVEVNGQSPDELEIPEGIRWIFQGDRGLTWQREPKQDMEVVAGDWWAPDYDGPPLVSLDAEVGQGLGIGPGDRLTINLLGRNVEVTIANLRVIEWADLTINFVMIFSPGLLERAPQSHIATVHLDESQEAALEQSVSRAFPNVSAVRVKEAVASFADMLSNVAVALSATASLALAAGVLVLAGAIAAGHHRRIYDAVVLKVLGATRWTVARGFLLEYGLLGLLTAMLAGLVGTVAAYFVVTRVMDNSFRFFPEPLLWTTLAACGLVLLFGGAGIWRALSAKAAIQLRNQ